ncbi:response regulator [Paenibacillus sp. GCM10027626]|uniref:response regulator n=1 Tax=Paenibacillus sp. GCM10027626 TaxID=3273411 RepID=UPI00362745E6
MHEAITLMVVDDEPLTRRKLRSFRLAEHGYKIIGEAENGVQALEQIDRLKPDIILADIGMPVMDGLELLMQIQKRNEPPKVIMLTCYEDFTKAQTAIRLGAFDYLTKLLLSEEDLLRGLDKAARQLRKERNAAEQTIRFMLQELILFPSERILSQLQQIPFKPRQFALATIRADLTADQWLIASYPLLETVCEPYRSIVIRMPERLWSILFVSFAENDTCNFHSWCAQQCSSFSSIMSGSLERNHYLMSFIPVRYRVMELFKAYKESVELFDSGFYLDQGKLLQEHDNRTFAADSIKPLESKTESIRKAVAERDYKEASSGIREWLELTKQLQPHPDHIKELGKEIVIIVAGHVGMYGSHYEPLLLELKPSLIGRLTTALHHSEVFDAMQTLTEFVHLLNSSPLTMRTEIKKAIHYIHKHYRDIDITSAAEYVNLSPSWFKTLFRKETGVSFHEFVQSYQLEMAKQLMVTTDMKVYEVAEAVGITNPRYFSRLFTKSFSVPPLDYRKQNGSLFIP